MRMWRISSFAGGNLKLFSIFVFITKIGRPCAVVKQTHKEHIIAIYRKAKPATETAQLNCFH